MAQPTASNPMASLAQIPLFAGLGNEEVRGLDRRAGHRTFNIDDVIFSAGDYGDTLYAVASGLVRIALPTEGGAETVVVMMGPGEFFGELSLFDGRPRSASVVAMAPSETLTTGRADFLSFLEEHPKASRAVFAVPAHRIRRMDELIRDAVSLDIPTRLAKKLLELADTFGEPGAQGVTIGIRLRQKDLASMVGAIRDSVSRSLAALRDQGVIEVVKDRITLLRPEALLTSPYA